MAAAARFTAVESRAQLAEAERAVLAFWKRDDVFRRSLELRRDGKPYVFYEGPPTANGKPGIHHVLARSFKDLFPRYRSMCGYSVERKGGWDTHGLPVELEVERSLHISGKKQIEEFGVARFNDLCRASVAKYIDEWEAMTERLGFWIDMDDPYRTYDGTYIESVWWSLKQLWDRDLLYQDYKVTPYCPRCQTSLSSHELSQGYQDDVPDPSVYVKFRLTGGDDVSLLAWTTTPWTLPGNVALAVHPDAAYVEVEQGGERLILARARLEVLDGDYTVTRELRGSDLVGRTYEPLFTDMLPEGRAFLVLAAPGLVSMEEGTGIVHTAAAYGEADLELCRREGVAVRHVVGLDGRFLEGQTRYRGLFVKDADPRIIADLQAEGRLYKSGQVRHSYPFCWRCDTPLLYYALTSWFIRTTAVKERLIENNRSVNWQPEHIRDGRMGNWLENLVDWNLSRTRYWGTPLPIWVCEGCDARRCVGSAAELGLTPQDDLHKPHIDEVVLTCEGCGAAMRRVPDVIDGWYDSGAMPFAQLHYPFENRERFAERHPADFICEAMDQTRGWFFSLLAESTLLFDKPSYRNVICLGLVLDRDGRKMSKHVGNIVDPTQTFAEFGADATRWYFYSAVAPGSDYRVSPELIRDVVRRFVLTLWNTYKFFCEYARIDGWDPGDPAPAVGERPELDRWCLARLAECVDGVRAALDAYDATAATRLIELFVEDLSKWYVRRSRRRFWKSAAVGDSDNDFDKRAAYATLFTSLGVLSHLLAPFMPFLAERIYRNLSGHEAGNPLAEHPDSVHLTDYPTASPAWRDPALVEEMARLRRLVEDGLAARETAGIGVRQPLREATVRGGRLSAELEAIFAEELNVKAVGYAEPAGDDHETVTLDTTITDELRLEGLVRSVSRKVNDLRKQAGLALDDRIQLRVEAVGELRRAIDAHRDHLMGEVLATAISFGRGEVLSEWSGNLGGEPCWLGVSR
ncbi:MAG: isoleucine--tRNA ligase [Candidatus Dormibacteria bacterium]|jgi:isoleucyl-tRNA synthetase|nr:isoleucine--tRNA ligase [Chloroflexota bacterium]HBV93545.1 isoleucine--tRNA ligase [Chloroflexota bacterium]